MSQTLVSVVVPVFDGERYLAEAIESVLGQSHRALELIVVDDGSTDASAAIARGYSGVRLVQQSRSGTGAARNAGLARARGAFVAHLDADDVWLPDKLERELAAFAEPRYDAACGLVEEFVSPELEAAEIAGARPPREPMLAPLLQALVIRREAHERVGPFETRWDVGQDLAWLLRARELGLRIAELGHLSVRRRLHARNKGRLQGALAAQRCRMLKESLDRRRGRLPQP